jgi:rubrerythrin
MPEQHAPEKPSYLDMLNAIYMGEQRGYEYLSAWADVTPDPDVRAVLRTIALREGEHALAFAKRINELGFEARDDGPSAEFHRKFAIVTSDKPDLEKMDTLGYNFSEPPKPSDEGDRLVNLFRDTSIDIQTGELLGRYIAEERDTGRLFRSCYGVLCERASGSSSRPSDRLAGLEAKVDAVCRGVEELRQIVCAQTMTTDSS